MAETDSLLKRLVSTFILDFAAWLLGTAVQAAHPLQSELPAATVAVDQVFQVTLANGRALLLHIEFQGRRSHVPLPWRMLEYMSRLAYSYRLDLESIVLYLGRGAGADDTGLYQVHGLAGAPVLAWGYRVIRLWQMPAEALLTTPHVAPLALVGQMQMTQPEATLPAVVARMRQVADVEQRGHLLTAFMALLLEEEMVSMVERLLEDDELLLELPYLQRIREAGREEGREAGREEGRREGEAEMLLRLLRVRFGPLPAEVTARVTTADPETLLRWSERVLSAPTLEAVFAD
jgi:predicted transposase YdaD